MTNPHPAGSQHCRAHRPEGLLASARRDARDAPFLVSGGAWEHPSPALGKEA